MATTLPKFIRLNKPAQPDEFGLADSVIGWLLCLWQGEMLVRLQLLPAHAEKDLSRIMLDAQLPLDIRQNDKRAQILSRQILFPANTWQGRFPKDLSLGFHGTDFQVAAMKKMLAIPPGKTMSYGELAVAAQKPGAARAVGSICAKNPLTLIVPCHRILASQNGLGGYGYGTALKRQLLDWEKSKT